MILLLTLEGDQINRCEIFDEAELDAALARFEELQPQKRGLENAASRAEDRFFAHTRGRNWAAMAEILADNSSVEDRRRVVNIGIWKGRDVLIANFQALGEAVAGATASAIAIRGERLVLTRICAPNRDLQQGDFDVEILGVAELDADERMTAHVLFDPEDIDAAFNELETRYLAGEGAAHSHAWSVIARAYATFNRRELPAMTRDSVFVDHRPVVAVEAVDLAASIRALLDLTSEVTAYIEAVHRLSERGAVITQVLKGTWQEGSDAQLWMIGVFTVEDNLISRAEVFDEADLDAALGRFEELSQPERRLENAASRAHARLKGCIVARDWNAAAQILDDDIAIDDRRRVVNSGIQHGRNAAIADVRGAIESGLTDISLTVTATRGDRLELSRTCICGQDRPESLRLEFFSVVEINADERIVARVAFDPEDVDAAFEELETRYVAGEAAVHRHTWERVTRAYKALNRRQLPETTPGWVNIDHRRLAPIPAGDLGAYLLATWEQSPQSCIRIEAVHRLSELGAVVTHVVEGTSQQGFDAEWRTVDLSMYEGDKISRCELFDEADLDAALARFDELSRSTPHSPRR
jgi:hypothetical protein